jgi:hypothetical protein
MPNSDAEGTMLRFAVSLALGMGFLATSLAAAQMSDVERDTVVRRACEAAIWGMPAVGIYDIELALQRDAGAERGVIGYMTEPMGSRHGLLPPPRV